MTGPGEACRRHEAFAPAGDALSERFHWAGFRALAEKKYHRCPLPDCRDSESLLRPSCSIDASPLTLLITRLECWRRSLPSIAVRDGTTHVRRLFSPYWVHGAAWSASGATAGWASHLSGMLDMFMGSKH